MNRHQLVCYETPAELRAAEAAWDDLWWRSGVSVPTARAELVCQWAEQFAPARPLVALGVREEGRLVAGLALVSRPWLGLGRRGALPNGCWSSSGELLLDPECDTAETLDRLVAGVAETGRRLGWIALDLRGMTPAAGRWRALRSALARAGLADLVRPEYAIGRIELGHDWEAYRARLSRGLRRNLGRDADRLLQQGPLELEVHSALAPDEVPARLREFLRVEDASWKGRAGTSVFSHAAVRDFFHRQARQLAAWGQLELFLLRHRGQPIAAEYGYSAKGVYYAHKIGYDPAYARCGPGHLLHERVFQNLASRPDIAEVDLVGPLCPATARWATDSYEAARLVVGLGATGRLLVNALLRPRASLGRFYPAEVVSPRVVAPSLPVEQADEPAVR